MVSKVDVSRGELEFPLVGTEEKRESWGPIALASAIVLVTIGLLYVLYFLVY